MGSKEEEEEKTATGERSVQGKGGDTIHKDCIRAARVLRKYNVATVHKPSRKLSSYVCMSSYENENPSVG